MSQRRRLLSGCALSLVVLGVFCSSDFLVTQVPYSSVHVAVVAPVAQAPDSLQEDFLYADPEYQGFLKSITTDMLTPSMRANADGQVQNADCPRPQASKKGVVHGLEFLHIPKTGGTSIEDLGGDASEEWGNRAWELDPPDGRHGRCTMTMPDGNTCNIYHVPPYLVQAQMYKNREVFCTVRHPEARALSEFKMSTTRKNCSSAFFNRWLFQTLREVRERPYTMDCHWIPQADYLVNPHTGERSCHHILQFSDLENEFNSLMLQHHYGVRLKHHKNKAMTCLNLTQADIWNSTRRLMRIMYKQDYNLTRQLPRRPERQPWAVGNATA